MNLSFRQLRVFREVMRHGSVSEAARAIGRSQPSVSAMLSNLEQELGFDLFQRHKGRIVPNPEAHYFLEEANFVLDRLAQSARTMREIGNLEKGQIKIACLPAASGFLLPRLLSQFVQDRPEVSGSLMTRSSAIVEELIASQQFDIGLAETPKSRGTIRIQSFELECICAVHKDDPLAKLPEISPKDLSGKPLAALYNDHPILVDTQKAFSESQADFFRRFELQTFQPALEMVERRVCYSVCDPLSAASYKIYRESDLQLIFIPFRPSIKFSLSILTPSQRPLSLLATAFCAELSEVLKNMSSDVNSTFSSSDD